MNSVLLVTFPSTFIVTDYCNILWTFSHSPTVEFTVWVGPVDPNYYNIALGKVEIDMAVISSEKRAPHLGNSAAPILGEW